MNQNELLETLSATSLHLSKAAVALTKVVDDKSSETPEAARRRMAIEAIWGSVQKYLDHSVIQPGMTQQYKT